MNSEPYSVIVTTFNAQDSIQKALLSITKMSPQPTEVIVVDDASSDNTQIILESFNNYFNSFRVVINKQNLGQSASRNVGVRLAQYPFIFFLDDDDECTKERAKIHLTHFQSGADLSFVSSAKKYSNGYEVAIINSNISSSQFPNKLMIKHFVLGKKIPGLLSAYAPSSTLAVRRDKFNLATGFDENMRRLEDIDFVCRAILLGFRISWSSNLGVVRTDTPGIDKSSEKNFKGELQVLEKNRNILSHYEYVVSRNMIYLRKAYFEDAIGSKIKIIPLAFMTVVLNPLKLLSIAARLQHDIRQR